MTVEQAARLLELRGSFSIEQVKSAFRRKARQTHPDFHGAKSEDAFKQAKIAFETLCMHLADRAAVPDRRHRPGAYVEPARELRIGDWFWILELRVDRHLVPEEDLGRRAQIVRINDDVFIAVYLKTPIESDGQRVDVFLVEQVGDRPGRFERPIIQRSYTADGKLSAVWFSPRAGLR